MKKLVATSALFLLISMFIPRPAHAQGIYKCTWVTAPGVPLSERCRVKENSCKANYVPECNKFTTQSSCTTPSMKTCVGAAGNPGTYDCTWITAPGVPVEERCRGTINRCNSGYVPGTECRNNKTQSECNAKKNLLCITKGEREEPRNQPTCAADEGLGIDTAIGCVPIEDPNAFIGFILGWAIGIGGGIAFLLILVAGFQIMTSTGNPDRLKAGQELLTSAIAGLILLIFSVFILKIIGVDILKLPGFGQ